MKRKENRNIRIRPRNRERRSRKGDAVLMENCRHQWSSEGICLKCGVIRQEAEVNKTENKESGGDAI